MEGDPDVDMQAYNTFFAEGEKLEKANSTEQAIKFYSKVTNDDCSPTLTLARLSMQSPLMGSWEALLDDIACAADHGATWSWEIMRLHSLMQKLLWRMTLSLSR